MSEEMIIRNVEPSNQIATRNRFADDNFDLVVDMTSAQVQFCSLNPTTDEDRAKLFNAMNNPEHRLSDFINKVIRAKDIYVEIVDCTNKETGEVTRAPRVVIIDDMGKGYQCVSVGVFSALKKIIQVYGAPTWNKPVKVEVKNINKGSRSMLTLNVVA